MPTGWPLSSVRSSSSLAAFGVENFLRTTSTPIRLEKFLKICPGQMRYDVAGMPFTLMNGQITEK